MSKIAILGHLTRHKEIFEILEMLGGIRTNSYVAMDNKLAFYISTHNIIDWTDNYINRLDLKIYTVEEFWESYPYKLGDLVEITTPKTNLQTGTWCIQNITWQPEQCEMIYTLYNNGLWAHSLRKNEIKPYLPKEETTTAPEPPQPAIDHASSNHALVKEALIARFMQMPKEDLAAALADITVSNALFKSAMSSLNTQDLCTLDAKVYINGQKIDTTFLDNTQTVNNQ